MMEVLKKIYEVLDEKDSGCSYPSTVDIARVIALFAHIGQYRDDGSPYFGHPSRCVKMINELIFPVEESEPTLVINEENFPRKGLFEVAYLHDVVEDTKISHENIKDIYTSYGYKEFFDKYIDEPLRLVTHDKKESYDVYINKVLTNPVSSFIKMVDLMDNLNLFSLSKLGDKEYKRARRYLRYYKMINDKYHFIERIVHASNEK